MSGALEMDSGEQVMADVNFEIDGLTHVLLARTLNRAVRNLAQAGILQPIVKVPVQCGVPEVKFDRYVPDGYSVTAIEIVKYCGECLDPIEKCDPCPRGYRVDDLCQITMFPAPSTDSATDLELCLMVKPSREVCEYPKEVIEKYDQTLYHGMMNLLLQMPGKDWTDPRLAAYHGQQFETLCGDAATEIERSYSRRRKTLNNNTFMNMEVGR